MRLLKASTIDDPSGPLLVEFAPDRIPAYAILSHTWGDDEATFTDFENGTATTKSSFIKIEYTCRQALMDGLEYAWIDTCCIDKRSSAELSEAINSMFEWYKAAKTCYVYLTDIRSIDVCGSDDQFKRSRWFTRGWTLQELLAPNLINFYTQDWGYIETKGSLSKIISEITNVDEAVLLGSRPIESVSVAKRMSWASKRETTRPEDIAYSLMGLFDVNMPMLYGEGQKAFLRLQEEIMKASDDHTLFAWIRPSAPDDLPHGLLADSPKDFANSKDFISYQDWEPRAPYSLTNRGLQINLRMSAMSDDGTCCAGLNCPSSMFQQSIYVTFIAVHLKKTSQVDEQYVRIKISSLEAYKVQSPSDEPKAIYVLQNTTSLPAISQVDAAFPVHVLQLCKRPSADQYQIRGAMCAPHEYRSRAKHTPVGEESINWNMTNEPFIPRVLGMSNKTTPQLAVAILFAHKNMEILVMIGSAGNFRAGFSAQEYIKGRVDMKFFKHGNWDRFRGFEEHFDPNPVGWMNQGPRHRVLVEDHETIKNGAKYHMLDIKMYPRDPDASGSVGEDSLNELNSLRNNSALVKLYPTERMPWERDKKK